MKNFSMSVPHIFYSINNTLFCQFFLFNCLPCMIFMIGYKSTQWWNQPHNDKTTISIMSLSTLLLFIPLLLIYFFSSPPPKPPTRIIIIKVSIWLFEPENGSQPPKRPRVSNLLPNPVLLIKKLTSVGIQALKLTTLQKCCKVSRLNNQL